MHITLVGMISWMHSAGLTLVSFAVLISVIVFFHELGHLLVGKWLGVKAVRFSIGFGPKLFGVQWGETEYRVSLLPLGGYVKFAGDNPLEQLAPEDRGRGFLEQPPRKKAAIAFAGPAANFLLALILYFAVNAAPHRDLAAKVGYVKPGSPAAQAGVQYGDRLTPAVHEETNPIETVKQGRIGISAAPRIAEIAITAPDTPAARAGLKTFDLVVKVAGQPVPSYEELERRLPSLRGPVPIEVLRRLEVPAPGGTLWAQEPVRLTLDAAGAGSGIECADLNLFAVQPGSAADEAGLRRGDRVISIDGKPVVWWFDEVETVRRAKGAEPFPMTVHRDGKLLTVTVRQHLRTERDESGIRVQVPELGAAPDAAIFSGETERIWVRYPIGEAAARSFTETVGAIRGLADVRVRHGHDQREPGPDEPDPAAGAGRLPRPLRRHRGHPPPAAVAALPGGRQRGRDRAGARAHAVRPAQRRDAEILRVAPCASSRWTARRLCSAARCGRTGAPSPSRCTRRRPAMCCPRRCSRSRRSSPSTRWPRAWAPGRSPGCASASPR